MWSTVPSYAHIFHWHLLDAEDLNSSCYNSSGSALMVSGNVMWEGCFKLLCIGIGVHICHYSWLRHLIYKCKYNNSIWKFSALA
jgi:hypothetical protein